MIFLVEKSLIHSNIKNDGDVNNAYGDVRTQYNSEKAILRSERLIEDPFELINVLSYSLIFAMHSLSFEKTFFYFF